MSTNPNSTNASSANENTMSLTQYGFTERFAAEAAGYPALFPARIVSQSRGLYRAVTAAGELSAAVSGKLQHEALSPADFPVVGDFVLLDRASGEHGDAVIHRVLSRRSVFMRKAAGTARVEQPIAANIDTAFICMSLNNDFNPRRLERYLAACWDSGATPVVVLTKADLCTDTERKLFEARDVAAGADVLVTSSMEQDGLIQVLGYVAPGKTIAFTGSSGVGKSTLINRLIGSDRLDTGGLRDDDKGRHTTTRRELLLLPGGGLVIDTPGMRELGIWEASEGLERSFTDVEALIAACRFSDCSHTREPGCAVQAALTSGALSAARWQSYQKLAREAAESHESMMARKTQKFKTIAKLNKASKSGK